MKVSLNWLKEYTDIKGSVDDIVQKIGAQLGAVEEVVDLGKKYQNIVVAKVGSCVKHPNADKLSLCMIDDGGKVKGVKRDSKGLVKVVCGAPNVKAGMFVAWLPPGTTVPASVDKDPLVLESREIRGEVSNGMLASAHELSMGDDHNGILDLSSSYSRPGDDFAKTYGLDDYIIDIENKMFTHRPDLFGILGVAREIAGIQHLAFKSPERYQKPSMPASGKNKLALTVKVEDYKLVPRFMAVPMTIADNNRSGPELISYLTRVGIRPINAVVDVGNYTMYLTAQPLHIYDYDKVVALSSGKGAELIARPAKNGESLELLGGKQIKLDKSDIVIATSKKAIGLAGVMGGAQTEVDENTKNIVIESANFDMYSIRRTAMHHGLFTDAVTRFNKGQSPFQTDRALALAMAQIEQLLQGEVVGPLHDKKGKLKELPRVSVTADFVNERLGTKLSLGEMAKLLENVEFKIMSVPANKKHLHVVSPFWRTDIEIPEDIVEEIGRLYGYDHLPIALPRRNIQPVSTDPLISTKIKARNLLSKVGANEVLTYTFVHGDLLKKVGQNYKQAYKLSNALSPDLHFYRLSLLPSLLDKVHMNIRAGYDQFALFDINPVHSKDYIDEKTGLPIEDHRLALVFAADDKAAQKYAGAAYYQALKYMQELLSTFGIEPVLESAKAYEPKMDIGKAALAPFEKSRAAIVRTTDGKLLGEIGEFRAEVRRNLKLPKFIAGFELDIKQIMRSQTTNTYQPIPRFPKVEQDITLHVKSDIAHGSLENFVEEQVNSQKPDNSKHSISTIGIYQADGDRSHKNVTFRVSVASYERTLTTEEINKLLDIIASQAAEEFEAIRI